MDPPAAKTGLAASQGILQFLPWATMGYNPIAMHLRPNSRQNEIHHWTVAKHSAGRSVSICGERGGDRESNFQVSNGPKAKKACDEAGFILPNWQHWPFWLSGLFCDYILEALQTRLSQLEGVPDPGESICSSFLKTLLSVGLKHVGSSSLIPVLIDCKLAVTLRVDVISTFSLGSQAMCRVSG